MNCIEPCKMWCGSWKSPSTHSLSANTSHRISKLRQIVGFIIDKLWPQHAMNLWFNLTLIHWIPANNLIIKSIKFETHHSSLSSTIFKTDPQWIALVTGFCRSSRFRPLTPWWRRTCGHFSQTFLFVTISVFPLVLSFCLLPPQHNFPLSRHIKSGLHVHVQCDEYGCDLFLWRLAARLPCRRLPPHPTPGARHHFSMSTACIGDRPPPPLNTHTA